MENLLHFLAFPELEDAILRGFTHDYLEDVHGNFYCVHAICQHSHRHPDHLEIITCISRPATLYLIAKNGCPGTYVEYWEHWNR